jgi:hypothetical protein
MNLIKKSYIIDWSGPYTLEDLEDYIDSTADCFYLISGLQKYQRGSDKIQYIGITERGVPKRLKDAMHHINEVA